MTNILVIDHEPCVTTFLKTVLSSETHRVEAVNHSREGLQLLNEKPFDILITAIAMPKIDGFHVLMEVNTMWSRPRVIIMTVGLENQSREYLRLMANSLNIQAILKKPFSYDDLMEAVFPSQGAEIVSSASQQHGEYTF
jgi:CheY-like chemotaxis protein